MSKKVRVNKAIFGRKVLFNNRVELEYYRKYKQINLAKELVSGNIHQAVGIAEGYIPSESAEGRIKSMANVN